MAGGEQRQAGVVEPVGEERLGPPEITSMNGRTRFPGDVRAKSVTRGGQEIEKVPRERCGGRLAKVMTLFGQGA